MAPPWLFLNLYLRQLGAYAALMLLLMDNLVPDGAPFPDLLRSCPTSHRPALVLDSVEEQKGEHYGRAAEILGGGSLIRVSTDISSGLSAVQPSKAQAQLNALGRPRQDQVQDAQSNSLPQTQAPVLPAPAMIKVYGARSNGAFAVVAASDDNSVRRAMGVVFSLIHRASTAFDVLVAIPGAPLPPRLDQQVRNLGAFPVALGYAPTPPHFRPKREFFRTCWHKLRLFLLSPYSAIVALDTDILILNNIDFLVKRVLNEASYSSDTNGKSKRRGGRQILGGSEKVRWFAARDETPLCDDCNAFPSGAPNAAVSGLHPDPSLYARLVHRSKFWSPWFGHDWSYAEQELMSIFFLVEADKNNAEVIWLDNGVNYFACKLRCPQHANLLSTSSNEGGAARMAAQNRLVMGAGNQRSFGPVSVLHFVGVPKPSEIFPGAQRRSLILNGFQPAFPEFRFMRLHYVQWYERYVAAMRRARAYRPSLAWKQHMMDPTSASATSLLYFAPNSSTAPATVRPKNFLAYVNVPRTGGSAVMKMVMRSLFGERWFYDECAKKNAKEETNSGHPPLCATYGDWTRPRDRTGIDQHRCTVLGCLGHLTLPRLREAFGPQLLRRTVVVVVLRHPVALFVEEFAYIRSELRKANPSLQFVQDQTLRDAMKMGMTLEGYAAYPHEHHDWHGAATNRQAFYLTGLPVPPPLSALQADARHTSNNGPQQTRQISTAEESVREETRRVLLKAIVTLRQVDFVGIVEDMPRLIHMLKCVIGLDKLEIPGRNQLDEVLSSVSQTTEASVARWTNDSALIHRIEELNHIDIELYEFGNELFDVRWGALGVMHKSGFLQC